MFIEEEGMYYVVESVPKLDKGYRFDLESPYIGNKKGVSQALNANALSSTSKTKQVSTPINTISQGTSYVNSNQHSLKRPDWDTYEITYDENEEYGIGKEDKQ